MIIGNLDINRIAPVPSETQAILVVDPYAVLPGAIALQRLEAVSGERRQINKGARVVKESQAASRPARNVRKAWNRVAVEDCLGVAPAETANHLFAMMRGQATLVNAPRSTSRD